jgi:hypothetical protein
MKNDIIIGEMIAKKKGFEQNNKNSSSFSIPQVHKPSWCMLGLTSPQWMLQVFLVATKFGMRWYSSKFSFQAPGSVDERH